MGKVNIVKVWYLFQKLSEVKRHSIEVHHTKDDYIVHILVMGHEKSKVER